MTSEQIKAENVPRLPRGLVELLSSNNGDGILQGRAFQLAAEGVKGRRSTAPGPGGGAGGRARHGRSPIAVVMAEARPPPLWRGTPVVMEKGDFSPS